MLYVSHFYENLNFYARLWDEKQQRRKAQQLRKYELRMWKQAKKALFPHAPGDFCGHPFPPHVLRWLLMHTTTVGLPKIHNNPKERLQRRVRAKKARGINKWRAVKAEAMAIIKFEGEKEDEAYMADDEA
ncbi:hypothetical protein FN846DRAFT_895398 [Sphaerosporella brunnea]|uniref:Uncharacterized protein n=1 Tax=Sphaerosporella brunnea TaxID=1250544 RepID=A0A5J5EFP0_9PEZI|nr:hypothetical protein FN846DRAFT_895398 [Sphaerosporella brunnea]